ncbi:hypothetical protein QYM36_008214 [Artemia franciscana]|uniref:Uncharacterized protein n=1 Tax=Artemia franciscana TaxID=6661 RepID=A0AA88IW81_ARTSF|nr:hypothetical protein QYM36_008214 [Artemia franciscana]
MQSSNPAKHCEFISNLGCLDKIDHVEQRRDKFLVFMKDKDSASSVASALPLGSRISAKVVKKEYLGIIRIDKGFHESNITGLVNSVTHAKRF